jgi:hypothetical protein
MREKRAVASLKVPSEIVTPKGRKGIIRQDSRTQQYGAKGDHR